MSSLCSESALSVLDSYCYNWEGVQSTGLPGLDRLLSGGLCCGEILELCGGAQCGKSQVALAAACQTVLSGKSTALYVSTTLDAHPFRASTLLKSSISARVQKWQKCADMSGELASLSTLLPRAAHARSYGGGLDAAFTEQALREDLPRAVQSELEGAGKALRFSTALSVLGTSLCRKQRYDSKSVPIPPQSQRTKL